jgi:hypothetical protein
MKMKFPGANIVRLSLFLLSALLLWGCAGSTTQPVAASKGVAFDPEERSAIERYYADARRRPAAPPAAIYKPGDTLGSGKSPQPLPMALKTRLSDLPEPYTRLVVGADVILVDRVSHRIADVVPAVAY